MRSTKPRRVVGGAHVLRSINKIVLATSLGLLLLLPGCSQPPALVTPAPRPTQAPATPTSVQTTTVARGEVKSGLTYSGNVQASRQVGVVPKGSGRVVKLNVDVGSEVKKGDVIAVLDTDMLSVQLAQAEASLALAESRVQAIDDGPREEQIAMAEANAKAARERVASLQEGGKAAQVAAAQANVAAAEARLRDAQAGASPEQIAVVEAQIRLAKNQLYAVQSQADAYLGSRAFTGYTSQMKDANSGVAYEQIQVAEAQLALLKSAPRADQIAQLDAAIAAAKQQVALAQSPYSAHDIGQAQAALEAAEQQVILAKSPFTSNDRKAAQAGVDQAKAAVDLVKLQMKEATIVAPFDGKVSQRLTSEGAMAGPTGPIVSIVSTTTEVVINVEEANLASVSVGQKASITTAAYPDVVFAATVTSLAPTLDTRSRSVQVRLAPEDTEGKLRDGMFAEVTLTGAGSQQSGLLIPKTATGQDNGESVAYVVADGKAQRRVVTLGATDGERVQVLSGLSEGESVASSSVASLRDGSEVVAQ
jgi:HlyD family secretion protein